MALPPEGCFTATGGSSGLLAVYRNPTLRLAHQPFIVSARTHSHGYEMEHQHGSPSLRRTEAQSFGGFKIHGLECMNNGAVEFIAVFNDRIALSTRTRVTVMKELIDRNSPLSCKNIRLSLVTGLEISNSRTPLPRTPGALHFVNKHILVCTYPSVGALAWDVDTQECIWCLPLEPYDIWFSNYHYRRLYECVLVLRRGHGY
ncbi:hypothetical protein OF83DRAFT_1089622 [Amylostereum chailletii]|nr:hypothetical protein OF83DRAFT_1089622 [Amylostereum chailletii]